MFNLLKDRELRAQGSRRLYSTTTGGLHFLQRLKLEKRLCVHDGCVNTICWNDQGNLILSGSDDQHLAITDPFTGKNVVRFRSGHRSNIFSAKFLPGSMDREVVSCSGSGEIFYTDVDREDTYGTNRFDCHFGTTYKLLVVPNEAATFLSCGDDGTVRFFDLRTKTSCSKFNCEEDVVVHLRNAVTAMAVDPVIPFHLAIASSDGIVRLYDRRMLKTRETGGSGDSLICKFSPPMTGGEKRHYRITSLNYRPGAHDVLVNYSSENIYMFNTYDINRQQNYSARLEPSGATSKPVGMTGSSQASMGGAGPSDGTTAAASAASTDNGSDSDSAFKPIKRLRLRGDWSDTGPDARPESEEPALTNTIMQRMSDLLTRMLNSRSDQNASGEGEDEEEGASGRNPREDEMGTSDADTRDETATSTSTDAAAMLRSVMFRSASAAAVRSLGNQARAPARYSISSEGLVSPELSSQDMDAGSQGEAPTAENEASFQNEASVADTCDTSNEHDDKLHKLLTVDHKDVVSETSAIYEKSVETHLDAEDAQSKSVSDSSYDEGKVAIEVDPIQPVAGGAIQTDAPSECISIHAVQSEGNFENDNPARQSCVISEFGGNDSECDMNVDTEGSGWRDLALHISPAGRSSHVGKVTDTRQISDSWFDMANQRDSAIEQLRARGSSSCDMDSKAYSCDKQVDVMDVRHSEASQNHDSLQQHENNSVVGMDVDTELAYSHVKHSQQYPPTASIQDIAATDKYPPASQAIQSEVAPGTVGLDSNSESNDSISVQMSTNLHIRPSPHGTMTNTVDQCPQSSGQLLHSDAWNHTANDGQQHSLSSAAFVPNQTSSQDLHILPVTYPREASESKVGHISRSEQFHPSCVAVLNEHTSVSPGAPLAFTTSDSSSSWSTSHDCPLGSVTSSWSDSTVAVADGVLSSYEGSNSQRTLNDVAHFRSVPNLSTSTGSSLTEITPTALCSQDSARNPSISAHGPNTSAYFAVALLDQGISLKEKTCSEAQLQLKMYPSPSPGISDSRESGMLESCGSVAECSVTDRSSLAPLSQDPSDIHVETAFQAGISKEEDGEQNPEENQVSSTVPDQYPKPVLGFFTSDTSEVIETAMVIPKVCVNCKNEFAIRLEEADCLQGQERLRMGLCPQCFRKMQQEHSQLDVSCQMEAAPSFEGERGHSAATLATENVQSITPPSCRSEEQMAAAASVLKTKIDKGKGVGKSSLRAKQADGKSSSFAPYNSGKMKISPEVTSLQDSSASSAADVPAGCGSGAGHSVQSLSGPNDLQMPTAPGGAEPGSPSMTGGLGAKSHRIQERQEDQQAAGNSERHRRVGYSLPPTGNFQLYGDDNDEDSEEDSEYALYKRKMMADKERMRQAAQKIQEIYRKKRESRELARMMEVPQPRVLMKYSGHRNCRTMIKEANFFGDQFVMSGSDCGRILAWERETGRMVMYMDADRHVVNCVQPNLYVPVLASSGIDYDIKIWSPLHEESQFDEEKAEMIIRRNELMLEETRDTVTVPAAFMLRILASLSQIRTGRNTGRGQQGQEPASQE